MKPAQFEYFAPATIAEAVDLLVEHGDDVKLLAGGQSLVPLMNMRLARPRVIVDLNGIDDLVSLKERDGGLCVGAMTRQRTVELSEVCRDRAPLLHEAIRYIGHAAIRNRGTVGGTIAHADPAAEVPAVVTAVGARLVIHGRTGRRVVGPEEFFVGYLTTALGPDEILSEIRFPAWPPGAGWSFMEISRRYGDFAIVGVACMLQADADAVCTDARLVFTGVGGTPFVSIPGQSALVGKRLSAELFERVQQAVSEDEELQPEGDIHASAIYRKEVAGVMAKRALRQASARLVAGGGQA